MKIFVKARPGAKEEKIEPPVAKLWTENQADPNNREWFKIWVKQPPLGGKANLAIAEVLAKYFKVPKSGIRLISGASSKQKVFEIEI